MSGDDVTTSDESLVQDSEDADVDYFYKLGVHDGAVALIPLKGNEEVLHGLNSINNDDGVNTFLRAMSKPVVEVVY